MSVFAKANGTFTITLNGGVCLIGQPQAFGNGRVRSTSTSYYDLSEPSGQRAASKSGNRFLWVSRDQSACTVLGINLGGSASAFVPKIENVERERACCHQRQGKCQSVKTPCSSGLSLNLKLYHRLSGTCTEPIKTRGSKRPRRH